MNPHVSAVIATYNRAQLLNGALEALSAQVVSDEVQWEIVVVDNNSRDETAKVVEAFARRTAVPVRYVFEPRQGLSHARNRGISEARGAIIAFTDDDVLPARDWIQQTAVAMDRWDAHGVGGRILPRWETDPPPWLATHWRCLGRLAIMSFEQGCLLKFPMEGRPQVWGANMAFRRELFEKVGGFDHALGIVGTKLFRGEEVALINRALEGGLRIAYDPATIVFHRIGGHRLRKQYFRKLEFDAAEGEILAGAPARGGTLFGAPPRVYLALFIAIWKWVTRTLFRRPTAFDRQLDCLGCMGQLWGYWKLSWRPRANEDRQA
jgi:glucosyl-dolichyl phosphate glucuronosyltransferase